MDIEKLLQEVIESDGNNKIDIFKEAIVDHWVYFFFNEVNGADTKPGKGNVEVVIFTSKENPIMVPLVENETGCSGVLYTNSDLAVSSAEFDCKVAKMRGRRAFKLFYELKNVDGIYILGNYGHLRPSREEFAALAGHIA